MVVGSRTEKIQTLLNELEVRLEKNPEDYDLVWNLPLNLFTYESKERIVAAIDYYNQLNKTDYINWVCAIVVGSSVHGESTSISDLDILPVYRDFNGSDSLRSQYERDVSSFVNDVAAETNEKYGFEISPKLLPHDIMKRVILSGCDDPPYFVLGNREEFYQIYNKRN